MVETKKKPTTTKKPKVVEAKIEDTKLKEEQVKEDNKYNKVNEDDKYNKVEAENNQLKEDVRVLSEQIKVLMAQINKPQEQIIVKQDNSLNANIKVTSMLNSPYCLSTQPLGRGRVYRFDKYLETKMIRTSDLLDIISVYSAQFEKGYVLLHSKADYEALGIEYIYEGLFTMSKMAKVLELKSTSDVNFILGIDDENLQESMLSVIAERVAKGEQYDFRLLSILEKETNLSAFLTSEKEKLNG